MLELVSHRQPNKAILVVLLVVGWLMSACTSTRTPSIPVELEDRQTLYFTGKGAAAGMMMDSLLGGAGVAIGIAIDEGIAKDISAAIKKTNPEFDIRNLVMEQLAIISDEVVTKNWRSLVIEKYGFEVVNGDFVSPVLELTVNCKGGAEKIHFERNPSNSDKAELELIKKDGEIGLSLLQHAVEEIMQAQRLVSLCGNKLKLNF